MSSPGGHLWELTDNKSLGQNFASVAYGYCREKFPSLVKFTCSGTHECDNVMYNILSFKFYSIICQVVAYGRLKTEKIPHF